MSDKWDLEKDLSVYERALESVNHTDTVMWEITAIIWGGNTLLLGFILEAIDTPAALPLIVFVAIAGLALTAFVARICEVAKITKKIGYGICREIEKNVEFPEKLRLHTQIDRLYPAGIARRWVYGISIIFAVIWIFVLAYTLFLLLCHASYGSRRGLI